MSLVSPATVILRRWSVLALIVLAGLPVALPAADTTSPVSRDRPAGAARATAVALGLPSEAAALPRILSPQEWAKRLEAAAARSLEVLDNTWHPHARASLRVFLPGVGPVHAIPDGTLSFPAGTIFRRQFRLASGTPIEERLQVVGSPDAPGYGANYRIHADGHLELLADGDGFEVTVAPGARPVTWCHPGLEEGLETPGWNPWYWMPTTAAEWSAAPRPGVPPPLERLRSWGRLEGEIRPVAPAVDWRREDAPAEARVRSYLHAHCAVCHQPGGAGRGLIDLRLNTPLPRQGLQNGVVTTMRFGLDDAAIVLPGDPERSILYLRLARTDFYRMPPMACHETVSPIAAVVHQWIRSLPSR